MQADDFRKQLLLLITGDASDSEISNYSRLTLVSSVHRQAADASKYGSDRTVDVAKVNAQGTIDNTRATGDETRKTQDNEQRMSARERADMHRYSKMNARSY